MVMAWPIPSWLILRGASSTGLIRHPQF